MTKYKIEEFYLEEDSFDEFTANGQIEFDFSDMQENQPCFIVNMGTDEKAIGIYKDSMLYKTTNHSLGAIKPIDPLQHIFANQILDNKIPLNIALGPAGTGKTLMAIAAAMKLIDSKQHYSSLILTKPLEQVGFRRIGDLPGGLDEKLDPYMQSFYGAFSLLYSKNYMHYISTLRSSNKLDIVPMQFMRGMDFKNSIIIADEMQNASLEELKTLTTRVHSSSKLILLGDLKQIDLKKKDDNFFGAIIDNKHFIESSLTSLIELNKVQRSPLTELMINIFDSMDL